MNVAALPPEQIDRAVALARDWQQRAAEVQTAPERRQQAELDRLLRAPGEKATLIQITDQAFRTQSPRRTVDQFTHILDVQGVPRFFSPVERALLKGFQKFGAWLPSVSAPLVRTQLQHETANVVLPAETAMLTQHLQVRQAAGVRMNVNFLGEALLGEDEARARLQRYFAALRLPELEVLSVKISTIYSQISPLAREATLQVLCDRLELLYREAGRLRFTRADGAAVPKFVYLDMEEYRDMSLTADAFMRTLDRRGNEHLSAGLALQAYIPDSFGTQQRISEWARGRVARGGAAVTIRLVKGANLEMERVEASIRGWPQAPYETKRETDANYGRMLREALRPENLAAVRVGVASHNLFDLALGAVLADAAGAGDRVQFEMLEGMANHQRRAIAESDRDLLLYAPACRKEEFVTAIGYLVRRLDENTGPDNFLRHAFRLQADSREWELLEQQFRASCTESGAVSAVPRRTQDRRTETAQVIAEGEPFTNDPDTDFSLPHNAEWAREIIGRWEPRHSERATEIPLVVDGEELHPTASPSDRSETSDQSARSDVSVVSHDPSRPGLIVARHRPATAAEIERAIACARSDPDGWRSSSHEHRSTILARVAAELRIARGELIGAALANTGKTIAEADPEVSEAVDFVEFYRRSAGELCALEGVQASPLGVVVIVPPWNFPIAIPCGGIAAALAAGNTVILKPATPAVLVAWELCQCFWRAGISRRVLQFVPCPGGELAERLVLNRDVDAVILTGGTATALHLLRARPDLRLSAETGGKNATIVTALSDREQAIKHVVHSAFSHGGQKCSATSLLLLEAEVYDNRHFREKLVDAARSLRVGPAWDLDTRIGPLIRPPRGELERGLRTLEPGEAWALTPEQRDPANPHLWSPGIKYGVQPGSFTHRTELFGPVLGVMRFEHLEEAIAMVNETGYGLTSGLQSLDDREQALWRDRIRAGNLYINKPTVGAIVLRQPFGGEGKSAIGPALKAGGPNYVSQFLTFTRRLNKSAAGQSTSPREAQRRRDSVFQSEGRDAAPPPSLIKTWQDGGRCGAEPASPLESPPRKADDLLLLVTAVPELAPALESYLSAWRTEFSRHHDDFHLLGEENSRRYLPIHGLRIRVTESDSRYEIYARAAAAHLAGCRCIISTPPGVNVDELEHFAGRWGGAVDFQEETDEDLAALLRTGQIERVRFAAPDRVAPLLRAAAAETGLYLADRPVLPAGRLELLHYLREQSISFAWHRYGNLSARPQRDASA